MSNAKHCKPFSAGKGRRHAAKAVLLAALISQTALGDAAGNKHHFDIPAQSLNQALLMFGRQSQQQLMYGTDIADNLRSRSLQGDYTADEAIRILLGDAPLQAVTTGEGAITLQPRVEQMQNNLGPQTMPAVQVVGKAAYDATDPYNSDYSLPNAMTATKTDTPIMETPFSVQVVPKQVMKDQQVVRIDKALQNVSGVFATAQDGHQQTPFVIRGFRTYDYYRDGVRTNPSWLTDGFRETANLERIEVLKGPASILYGRIEPGGMVNVVTKQPLATPFYSLQQQFGSYDFYRTTVDATGPVTQDKSWLYRMNFAYEDANSFRDFVKNDRVFFAPKLQWKISDQTQATFELEYKHSNDTYDNGIPIVNGQIPNLPISRNLSEPGSGQQESDAIWLGFNWSHAFNDNWTLSQNFNAYNYAAPMRTPFVTFWGGLIDPCTASSCQVALGAMKNNWSGQQFYTSLNLTGKFQTGSLGHTLMLGWDFMNMAADSGDAWSWSLNALDIYHPVYTGIDGAVPSSASLDRYQINEDWRGLYLQDQIKLPYGLQILGGFRYDMATMSDLSSGGYSGSNQLDETAIKPRVGLLWRALPELSFYANYVENFGGVNLYSRNRNGGALKPETAEQKEIGLKYELFDKRLTGSVAWFDLTKQNIQSPDPDPYYRSLGFSVTTGEVNNNGLEVDIAGEVYPGLKLIGNYSYTNSRVTKDTGGADNRGNEGKRYFGVPRHGGNLWATYEIQKSDLQGWKFGAGSNIRGEVEGDNANSYQLPGYATLALMTGYSWKMGPSTVTAQLNADNLLDKHYYNTSNSNFIMQAAPRTFLGTLKVEF
ncbi:TonB-dependent siderophore receptor [Methylomonas sp. 2BW1-5-20]|uniref:TonB-dependent siderophore receptor n=1 Tax=Methylomonas sp. 2BW1-5-20 TaxID=3376686 RepID=UPI00405005E8